MPAMGRLGFWHWALCPGDLVPRCPNPPQKPAGPEVGSKQKAEVRPSEGGQLPGARGPAAVSPSTESGPDGLPGPPPLSPLLLRRCLPADSEVQPHRPAEELQTLSFTCPECKLPEGDRFPGASYNYSCSYSRSSQNDPPV